MTPPPDTTQPQTAPETQVSGRRSLSPARDVVLAAIDEHADYRLGAFDDGGPDRCDCGAILEASRGLAAFEVHRRHQADAIVAALLREVLA